MPSSDSRGAGRSCITTYIVVDILPQSASADGIITTKHLHFRIKQEEIDCKQRNLISWIDFVCLLINIYRIRIVRFVKRKHCCRSASNSTNHCFDLITYGSTFTYAKIRNIIKDVYYYKFPPIVKKKKRRHTDTDSACSPAVASFRQAYPASS